MIKIQLGKQTLTNPNKRMALKLGKVIFKYTSCDVTGQTLVEATLPHGVVEVQGWGVANVTHPEYNLSANVSPEAMRYYREVENELLKRLERRVQQFVVSRLFNNKDNIQFNSAFLEHVRRNEEIAKKRRSEK